MYIDKNTQADFYFYLDMIKDSCGSRPRGAEAEWFVSLTEAERQAEIQRHIDSVNEMTEFLEAEYNADIKYLKSFGDFSERINST
jgi:fructose-1-phosphate kinase PfkB-like protein